MPFATVHFPIPAQGLVMMHKLREYRRLRELSWSNLKIDPKSSLTKKTQIARQMMAYKPYAVADLADILLKQEKEGEALKAELERIAQVDERKVQAAREKRRNLMIEWAKRARRGEVPKVKKQIDEVLARWTAATGRQRDKLRNKLRVLRATYQMLRKAENSVTWTWWKWSWDVSEKELKNNSVESKRGKIVLKGKRRVAIPRREPRESFIPTTERVRIDWYDLRDAEYAAKWPDAVAHGQIDRPKLLEKTRHGHARPTPGINLTPAWKAAYKLAAKAATDARVKDKKERRQLIMKIINRKHKEFKLGKAPAMTPTLELRSGNRKRVEIIRNKAKDGEKTRDVVSRGRLYHLPLESSRQTVAA